MAKKDERTLVVCSGCDSAYAAYIDEDESLRVVAGSECPQCGGTEFTEVSKGDVEDG